LSCILPSLIRITTNCSFFRSLDWGQLLAGQIPSPLRLDDINDFGHKSPASKSKAQVPGAKPFDFAVFFCTCCCSAAQLLSCSAAQLLSCSAAQLLSCSAAQLLSCSAAQLLSCGVAEFASQAVLNDSGKKPVEGFGADNAFKDFDFSRAATGGADPNLY
jgi:hypothetical protein